jgi:hypothetical protein
MKTATDLGLFHMELIKFKETLISVPSSALEDLQNFMISNTRSKSESVIEELRNIIKSLTARPR